MADEAELFLPDDTVLLQDTGFQGFAPPGAHVVQPTKKPKGKELSEEQKHDNRRISSQRCPVEHCIGGVKVFRIVKDVLRLRSDSLRDAVMETCTALYNFKVHRRTPPH
jgi:hypothetical protein